MNVTNLGFLYLLTVTEYYLFRPSSLPLSITLLLSCEKYYSDSNVKIISLKSSLCYVLKEIYRWMSKVTAECGYIGFALASSSSSSS